MITVVLFRDVDLDKDEEFLTLVESTDREKHEKAERTYNYRFEEPDAATVSNSNYSSNFLFFLWCLYCIHIRIVFIFKLSIRIQLCSLQNKNIN